MAIGRFCAWLPFKSQKLNSLGSSSVSSSAVTLIYKQGAIAAHVRLLRGDLLSTLRTCIKGSLIQIHDIFMGCRYYTMGASLKSIVDLIGDRVGWAGGSWVLASLRREPAGLPAQPAWVSSVAPWQRSNVSGKLAWIQWKSRRICCN